METVSPTDWEEGEFVTGTSKAAFAKGKRGDDSSWDKIKL
jgi:hypothetical protein